MLSPLWVSSKEHTYTNDNTIISIYHVAMILYFLPPNSVTIVAGAFGIGIVASRSNRSCERRSHKKTTNQTEAA